MQQTTLWWKPPCAAAFYTDQARDLVGPCARCEVVCTDPALGRRTGPEPLLTLASFRRRRGRILFGLLLEAEAQSHGSMAAWLSVDAVLQADSKAAC